MLETSFSDALFINIICNIVVDYDEMVKRQKGETVPELPNIESWLQKYYEKHDEECNDHISTFWTYPEHLETRSDLPPSLKKFKPEDFLDSDFEEWGV